MNKQRILVGLLVGIVLGIVCIIGARVRGGGEHPAYYLIGFWYNRVIMGVLIGALPLCKDAIKRVVRGALIGLAVSFAFYVSTGFTDLIGFLVGAVYGIILESVLWRLDKTHDVTEPKHV